MTAGRIKPGGLNPELVELRGVRYAVMQEPSPDEKINVGPMKMLTSGKEDVQCRAPFMPETLKFVPQFKLCLCTNSLMKIDSLDDGTWRRIRLIEFLSVFTEFPVSGDSKKPYQFKVVHDIDSKFDSWKEVFMSMLVSVARRTKGHVTICERVVNATEEYKAQQNLFGSFMRERTIHDDISRTSDSTLRVEFIKWFTNMYGDKNMPKPKDLFESVDKTYGKRINGGWIGFKVVSSVTEDEPIPEESFEEA